MTKYQSSIDGLQRILDEYPGTHHGFDYAFLSEEESKTIIREARDSIIELRGMVKAYEESVRELPPVVTNRWVPNMDDTL